MQVFTKISQCIYEENHTETQHQEGNSIILLKNFLFPSNFILFPNVSPAY